LVIWALPALAESSKVRKLPLMMVAVPAVLFWNTMLMPFDVEMKFCVLPELLMMPVPLTMNASPIVTV